MGLWGISPLYIGYGTNEWLRFGVGFFLSYILTGVRGTGHSLPLKNKKACECKPCMCVVGGMVVCVPTIYHRHTSIPHTHYYTSTHQDTAYHYTSRYYHIRLTDTLSVSSYIVIGLLFKQTFGWFSIRHERWYHYNPILSHTILSNPSSEGRNGWICSRKRQRLEKSLHYIRRERRNAEKNNPKKVEKSVALNRAMLYNTDVSRERGTNPEPGWKVPGGGLGRGKHEKNSHGGLYKSHRLSEG